LGFEKTISKNLNVDPLPDLKVTTAALRSEQMCNYDLDDLDIRWLAIVNGERALMGKELNTYLRL
jgi:hypothetical protein